MTDTKDVKQEMAETLADSSSEQKTPEIKVSEPVNQTESQTSQETLSPEEADWNNLKGTTQDRIKQLIRERDDLKNKNSQTDYSQFSQPVPPPSEATVAPEEVRKAADTLRTYGGMASKEDLQNLLWQVETARSHERLETKYDGRDGLPKYDKQEVEDYMNRKAREGKPIWDPEAAFRDMYFDEFVDAKRISQRRGTYSEKPASPSSTGREEPLTLESLKEKLSGPNGREFYEKLAKNPEQMNHIISELTKE